MPPDWLSIIEGILFVSPTPVSLRRFHEILDGLSLSEIRSYLEKLQSAYQERGGGLEVKEVAGGFQIYTRPELSPWIRRFTQRKPTRLSRPSLETLAIIAYNQPISRAEIESIRGVDSQKAIRSLLEKGMVRVMGRKEMAGRPLLYGTTRRFLEHFGLKDLSSLPSPEELAVMGLDGEN